MGYRENMYASNHIFYDCTLAPLPEILSTEASSRLGHGAKMVSSKFLSKLCALGLACVTLLATTSTVQASPFATEIYAKSSDLDGSGDFNDANAMLGKPTTDQYSPGYKDTPGKNSKIKITESPYIMDTNRDKIITTINKDSWAIVKFDHMVKNDAKNPYGIDFLVFGNTGLSTPNWNNPNMNEVNISGGTYGTEEVKVSVSPGFEGLAGQVESDHNTWRWYTYTSQTADNFFPTQGYHWDAANAKWTDNEMDFTKPVDPALKDKIKAGGMTAAQVIEAYKGSGGGTGFDLAESGFDAIQYIKVTGNGGEVDAFADVAATPEPASLALLTIGGLTVLRRRKRK